MVTSGTDDKSRTSESNLPGERTSARKLRVPSAICKRASPSELLPFFRPPPLLLPLFFSSSFILSRIIYASISNLRETVRKIIRYYSKVNRIEKR